VRRAVIDPLWLVLAVGLAAVLAGLAAIGLLVAPLARRRRLLRAAMLGLAYLRLDVTLLLGCLVLGLRAPRPSRRGPEWADAHCRLLTWALEELRSAAAAWAGFEMVVETEPADEPPHGPAIVLARHAGVGDSFALVHLILTRYRRRPRVVLKSALQWDPGIDVILNRLSGCFLPSRSGTGDDLAERLAEVTGTMRDNDALLLFPEGRNWTPRRHRRATTRLRHAGRHRAARRAEAMPRVLPPRAAGTLACIGARPDAQVVVVAHTGLDRLVTPSAVWRALPLVRAPLRVAWWCVRPPRFDATADGAAWLDDQWARVDAWIADHQVAEARAPESVPAVPA
jgi:1-acyl-sn-glycerol-3-phosphate acyltransferase